MNLKKYLVISRYLMVVICTSTMTSSILKYSLDFVMAITTSPHDRCFARMSISVPAVTAAVSIYTLMEFEPMWFSSTRRNAYTLLFAMLFFLLDCTFGDCLIVSFIFSYGVALTAIQFQSTLVAWYELHCSKIWLSVAMIVTSIPFLGVHLYHLKNSHVISFKGGVASIIRPFGCFIGLMICDKLDQHAYLRDHICRSGLRAISWLVSSFTVYCFVSADWRFSAHQHIVSLFAIPTLVFVYTVINCRFIPLLDLRQMEYRNAKFVEMLSTTITSYRKSNQRNNMNGSQMKHNGTFPGTNQPSINNSNDDLKTQIPNRDLEVADLMKNNTSTMRLDDATTRRNHKGENQLSKVFQSRRFYDFLPFWRSFNV